MGSVVQAGTAGVAAFVAEWFTARADGAARFGPAAAGRWSTHPAVAKNVALTPKTVWLTSQRYRQGGLERALYERPRPGKAALLDAQHRQRIVALACGPPPEGRSRWTVRLLTEEVVKRKLVPRVGRETIRVLLESHDLKPWREKNVVRGGTG